MLHLLLYQPSTLAYLYIDLLDLLILHYYKYMTVRCCSQANKYATRQLSGTTRDFLCWPNIYTHNRIDLFLVSS